MPNSAWTRGACASLSSFFLATVTGLAAGTGTGYYHRPMAMECVRRDESLEDCSACALNGTCLPRRYPRGRARGGCSPTLDETAWPSEEAMADSGASTGCALTMHHRGTRCPCESTEFIQREEERVLTWATECTAHMHTCAVLEEGVTTPTDTHLVERSLELSWSADRAWLLRMHSLLLQCARLQMLMAWCSTLGGAHSSLGDRFYTHAEKAGTISQQQFALATQMGDANLICRCKLFAASSLIQRGHLKPAAKIIREQYKYAAQVATVRDPKLIAMCMAAWIRLRHLWEEGLRVRQATPTDQPDVEIQELS